MELDLSDVPLDVAPILSQKRKGASRYKGVGKSGNKFSAYITYGGKNRYLGSYETEHEAAVVYTRTHYKLFKSNHQHEVKSVMEELLQCVQQGGHKLPVIDQIGGIDLTDVPEDLTPFLREEKDRGSCPYKGAARYGANKFQAFINFGGKQRYLGLYNTAREAAVVYARAHYKIFREKAEDHDVRGVLDDMLTCVEQGKSKLPVQIGNRDFRKRKRSACVPLPGCVDRLRIVEHWNKERKAERIATQIRLKAAVAERRAHRSKKQTQGNEGLMHSQDVKNISGDRKIHVASPSGGGKPMAVYTGDMSANAVAVMGNTGIGNREASDKAARVLPSGPATKDVGVGTRSPSFSGGYQVYTVSRDGAHVFRRIQPQVQQMQPPQAGDHAGGVKRGVSLQPQTSNFRGPGYQLPHGYPHMYPQPGRGCSMVQAGTPPGGSIPQPTPPPLPQQRGGSNPGKITQQSQGYHLMGYNHQNSNGPPEYFARGPGPPHHLGVGSSSGQPGLPLPPQWAPGTTQGHDVTWRPWHRLSATQAPNSAGGGAYPPHSSVDDVRQSTMSGSDPSSHTLSGAASIESKTDGSRLPPDHSTVEERQGAQNARGSKVFHGSAMSGDPFKSTAQHFHGSKTQQNMALDAAAYAERTTDKTTLQI